MKSIAEQSLSLLGQRGKDRITGASGTITSICFDLYGCVQVSLTPTVEDRERNKDVGYWMDIKRVWVDSLLPPVMQAPDFLLMKSGEEAGPAEKPSPRQ